MHDLVHLMKMWLTKNVLMNKTIPAGNQHLNRVLLIDVVIIDNSSLFKCLYNISLFILITNIYNQFALNTCYNMNTIY